MDIITRFLADTSQMKDADRLVKKVGTTTEQTSQKVSNLGKNMRLTKGPTSALSTTAGQLGVQFQDVAVQAEAGTDAVRIFSQQGPQILSIFGPTGAVFGAIAAIGVVVGKTLVDAFNMGGESVVNFTDSVKKVQKSVDDLTDGSYGLSESLRELATTSEAAAKLQIAIALDAAEIAARRAGEAFDRLGLEGRGMNRALEEGSQATRDFAVALEDIRRGEGSAASFSVLKRAAEGLGISIQEIQGISESYLQAIDPEAGGAALVSFAEQLSDLAIRSDDPAFREFANNLLQTALEAESTEERARLLSQAIDDLGSATSGANQKQIDFVEKLEQMAKEAGKTREEILKLQAAQIEDPALKARADAALARIEEQKAQEEAAEKAKKLEEDKQAFIQRLRVTAVRKTIQLQNEAQREQDELQKQRDKEEADREKRILAEKEAREKYAMELVRQRNEEELRQRTTVNEALLGLENKLMQGKSEVQKAGFRIGVNLMNQEKRENAAQILSDSYSAAMKAYKALAGIPIVGPALGAAAAGVIIAAGATYSAKSLAGRAVGGQVRAGESYVVGERGPEVLTMGTNGKVIPNDKIGGQQQVVNKTANITFQISTVDARGFDSLLQSRRGQIINMVNTAMNDKGRRGVV